MYEGFFPILFDSDSATSRGQMGELNWFEYLSGNHLEMKASIQFVILRE